MVFILLAICQENWAFPYKLPIQKLYMNQGARKVYLKLAGSGKGPKSIYQVIDLILEMAPKNVPKWVKIQRWELTPRQIRNLYFTPGIVMILKPANFAGTFAPLMG